MSFLFLYYFPRYTHLILCNAILCRHKHFQNLYFWLLQKLRHLWMNPMLDWYNFYHLPCNIRQLLLLVCHHFQILFLPVFHYRLLQVHTHMTPNILADNKAVPNLPFSPIIIFPPFIHFCLDILLQTISYYPVLWVDNIVPCKVLMPVAQKSLRTCTLPSPNTYLFSFVCSSLLPPQFFDINTLPHKSLNTLNLCSTVENRE